MTKHELYLHRAARPTLLGVALCSLVLACDFDAAPPAEMHYTLSDSNLDALAAAETDEIIASAASQGAQVLGALEMFFGSQNDPRYLVMEDWIDERFPNHSDYAELVPEVMDDVALGNQRRFKFQLQVLARNTEAARELMPDLTVARDAYAPTGDKIAELEAQIEEKTGANDRAISVVDANERSLKKLRLPNKDAKASIKKLNAVAAAGKSELGIELAAIPERIAAIETKGALVKETQAQVDATTAEIEALQAELATTQSDSAAEKAALDVLEAQITALFMEVPEPRHASDLWARFVDEFIPGLASGPDTPYDAEDDEYGTWSEEAVYLLENHYPTLDESAELYRKQCLHCHGVSGGGDGPTAEFLEPLPRDYRQGKFKWIAVDRNMRPRRTDLLKILEMGSNGTAMPSFSRFSRGELEGLVDYVRLLSMRGEVESLLVLDTINEGALPEASVFDSYMLAWENWDKAESKFVFYDGDVPLPTDVDQAMLDRGRELYNGVLANCFSCHGVDGRGEGDSLFEADESGKITRILDEWGNPSNPRNFRQSIFRGGSRPIDLYRRIKYGISGTIMPAAAEGLTDQNIWDVAYYVLSIAEKYDVSTLANARAAAAAAAHTEEEGH